MVAPLTMADLLKNLMDKWEEALQITIATGYWKDTEACDRIVAAYGDEVADRHVPVSVVNVLPPPNLSRA